MRNVTTVLTELNNTQAAAELGMSREAVRKLRKELEIPLPQVNRKRAEHGTRARYNVHVTEGSDADKDCPGGENGITCAEAHRRYQREYMRKRGGHKPRKTE